MRKREGNKEKAILDAAISIFAQNGYENAKISTIAQKAGVATGSVYLYYKNKEGILLTIFDQLWLPLTHKLMVTVKRTDIDPSQKLDIVIEDFLGFFVEHPAIAAVFIKEQHKLMEEQRGNAAKYYNDFFDIAEEIIKEGADKKNFNSEINIKLARYFILGGLRNILLQWAQHPDLFTLEQIKQNAKYLIKQGLK